MWFLLPTGCFWRSCYLALGQKKELDDFCAPHSVHHKPAPCGTKLPVPGRVSMGPVMLRRCQRGPCAGPLSLPTGGSVRLCGTSSGLVPDVKSLSSYVKLESTSS